MKRVNEIFMHSLGALLILGFFVLLFLLVVKPVPVQNGELLYLVAGALIGNFSSVVNYFFGSSMGSKQKTELLAKKPQEGQ